MVTYDPDRKLDAARERMIVEHLQGRGINDPAVLEAMRAVPREQFVTEKYYDHAYDDNPLPIGMGQTISQPYIVALMTAALGVQRGADILEIGTGCGYQTAVLAKAAGPGGCVYTIERHNQLLESAQAKLEGLGITNVQYAVGDGSKGWVGGEMSFDGIIVTAAAPKVPQPLEQQLKDGGVMVIPVGGEFSQQLLRIEKSGGKTITKELCGCRFVKLLGEYGFSE